MNPSCWNDSEKKKVHPKGLARLHFNQGTANTLPKRNIFIPPSLMKPEFAYGTGFSLPFRRETVQGRKQRKRKKGRKKTTNLTFVVKKKHAPSGLSVFLSPLKIKLPPSSTERVGYLETKKVPTKSAFYRVLPSNVGSHRESPSKETVEM